MSNTKKKKLKFKKKAKQNQHLMEETQGLGNQAVYVVRPQLMICHDCLGGGMGAHFLFPFNFREIEVAYQYYCKVILTYL